MLFINKDRLKHNRERRKQEEEATCVIQSNSRHGNISAEGYTSSSWQWLPGVGALSGENEAGLHGLSIICNILFVLKTKNNYDKI